MRTTLPSDFKELLRLLDEKGVEYLIVGRTQVGRRGDMADRGGTWCLIVPSKPSGHVRGGQPAIGMARYFLDCLSHRLKATISL
jgi:hypothetical protein